MWLGWFIFSTGENDLQGVGIPVVVLLCIQ